MTTRRHFMSQTAAAASVMSFPLIAGAQAKTVKVGVLHPVTGALAYSGQQCRLGALMAIEDINKAGGIKSLGGAKIEAVLGDAQSSPQAGTAEIEKMNEAGVKVGRAEQTISARLADAEMARHLDVPVGSALLSVRRLIYDQHDKPVQWLLGLYRPDRYEYQMQLSRVGSIDAQIWVDKELSANFH